MTERWIALSVAIGSWTWLWPIGAVFAAAGLRLLEHVVIDEVPERHDLTRVGKLLVELLSAASQVAIVAAGVGFALLWGSR